MRTAEYAAVTVIAMTAAVGVSTFAARIWSAVVLHMPF